LANQPLVYSIVEKHVIIEMKVSKPMAVERYAKTVKGTVYDADGNAVVGANIVVKNTSRGTSTN
jgi:hypothetical protein